MAGFFDPPQGLFGYFPDEQIDVMGGVQQAFAENRRKPPPTPGALQNIVGYLADYLAQMGGGGPIYAPTMARKQDLADQWSMYERKRDDDLADWYAQQDWKLKNDPDVPGIAKTNEWYWSLPPEERARAEHVMKIMNPGAYTPPSPVTLEPGDVIEGAASGGGAGEITATNPQTGEKVRYNPQTGGWEPIGGASPSNGSPTF